MSLAAFAKQGRKRELVSALESGTNVNQTDTNKRTALYYACWRNHMDIVTTLLNHKYINVNLKDSDGFGAFREACFWNRYEIVLILLNDGRTDLNLLDKMGWTPFMSACCDSSDQIIKLMIAFGRFLDVDVVDQGKLGKPVNAMDIAKGIRNRGLISDLLMQYDVNLTETRQKLRSELNLKGSHKRKR